MASVFRISDQEKLSKVIGRLIDNALQSERITPERAKEFLDQLQNEIDSLDDEAAAFVLNGQQSERQV